VSAQLSIGAIVALQAPIADPFELGFWPAYPRKVGKGQARVAWITATRKAAPADIVCGLLRYQFSPDPKFIPHPATWLNGERWADVIEDLTRDAWGLTEWLAKQPAPADGALFWAGGYDVEALAEVLLAAGLAPEWRDDLDTLGAWLEAGYRPDSVRDVLAEAYARNGSAPRSLASVDRLVRARALFYDQRAMEWRRINTR